MTVEVLRNSIVVGQAVVLNPESNLLGTAFHSSLANINLCKGNTSTVASHLAVKYLNPVSIYNMAFETVSIDIDINNVT